MGCNIHTMIEARVPWFDDEPSGSSSWANMGEADYLIGRNYELFEILAGVRAGYGLAVISRGRGAPEDMSEAGEAFMEAWSGDAHSHGWATLAELKAYDLSQEFDDEHLVLSRDESGKITCTCAGTTGPHLGPVGHRKVFGTWGPATWNALIAKMESCRHPKLGDDSVRLIFWFDN